MHKSLTTSFFELPYIAILSALLVVPLQTNAASTTQSNKASQCEDRGGYPWGWDPITLQSCRLDQAADTQTEIPQTENSTDNCIDTQPQGDGWGWNGAASCRITLAEEVYQCDDSGHYPWGWNPTNNTTCRIDLSNITQPPTVPVPYTALVNIPIVCRKIEKQNSQGINILAQDNNLFYSTTLTPLEDPEELYTFTYSGQSSSGQPSSKVFAPIRIDVSPWVFLHALTDDRTPTIGFLRFDQLQNGSFNISERDDVAQWTTTSRCVVR